MQPCLVSWQPASIYCMEDGENDPVVRQTVLCREREKGRETEKMRREKWRREKVCGGARVAPRDRRCAMIGYRHAVKEWEREGGQRAHLQSCVLYCCTDSAINHRDVERGGKLDRKGWRYRRENEVKNERKRGELLRGIQRLRVIGAIRALHALPPTQNGGKMDLLQPVIHQRFWENPLHTKWWKFA